MNPKEILNRPITFLSAEERLGNMIVVPHKILTEFGGGWFSVWVIEILTDKGVFVLKRFKIPADYPDYLPSPARNSINNYEMLLQAGLKTWSIYLLSDDQQMILMPSGNQNNKSLISTSNDATTPLGSSLLKNGLREIHNFEKVIKEMKEQVNVASEARIYIQTDTYGFLLDNDSIKTGASSFDFILADLDNVWKDEKSSLLERNLDQLRFTIQTLIDLYVVAECKPKYLKILNESIINN